MTTNQKDIFQYVFGAIIALCFFLLVVALTFKVIPDGNKSVLELVVGALIGSFTTVVGYFFGSSRGSAEKSEMLRTMVPRDENLTQ